MLGKATLYIPATEGIGASQTRGLSDGLAITMGRLAALTLSDQDKPVVVMLSDGSTEVIRPSWSDR